MGLYSCRVVVVRRSGVAWSIVVLATVTFYAGLALTRYASGWVTMGAASAVPMAVMLGWYRERLLAWLPLRGRDLCAGVLAGAVMAAATYAGFALLVHMHSGVVDDAAALYDRMRVAPGPILALPILLLTILVEEMVWRGVLIDGLELVERPAWVESEAPVYRGWAAAGVALLAAGVYAVPQLGAGSLLLVGVAFGCGVVWSGLRLWTGAVTAPLVAHLLWDSLVLVIHPLR